MEAAACLVPVVCRKLQYIPDDFCDKIGFEK